MAKLARKPPLKCLRQSHSHLGRYDKSRISSLCVTSPSPKGYHGKWARDTKSNHCSCRKLFREKIRPPSKYYLSEFVPFCCEKNYVDRASLLRVRSNCHPLYDNKFWTGDNIVVVDSANTFDVYTFQL